jgi:HSP20 family molecular chaperone IbpA
MTLSLGGEWSLHVPSPLIPRTRLVSSKRPSAPGARAPRPPRQPRNGRRPGWAWLPWRRAREVAVVLGPASSLQEFSDRAARPKSAVDETADAVVLTLDAPGARPKNTHVVWDEEQRRLVVGVWADAHPGRREIAQPELAWYRSHWLPRCDGRAARVTVNHGAIEIVVPWLKPGDAANAGAMRPRPTPLDNVSGEFIG